MRDEQIVLRIKEKLKRLIIGVKPDNLPLEPGESYLEKYKKYAFNGTDCRNFQQYEAVITRLYHTIEKGLSYEDYRAGFGKENIESMLSAMEAYVKEGYCTDAFFYRTALSCLKAYIEKNADHGYRDDELEIRVNALPGEANELGGSFCYSPHSEEIVRSLPFRDLISDRHSVRHFRTEPVDVEKLKDALSMAQHTPSACNRQGWYARIIADRESIQKILKNQNGNSGFGQEIDKLILITGDLRYFNLDRETFQVFVDGGMYAANVLNALHCLHIGTIPLSASLTDGQEKAIRELLTIDDAEVFILFIGVGNYPEKCLTTKSARHETRYQVI